MLMLHHWRRILPASAEHNPDTLCLDIESRGLSEATYLKLTGLALRVYEYSTELAESPGVFPDDDVVRGAFSANASCRIYIGFKRLQFFEYGDRASNESKLDDFTILQAATGDPEFEIISWQLGWQSSAANMSHVLNRGPDLNSLLELLARPVRDGD